MDGDKTEGQAFFSVLFLAYFADLLNSRTRT